MITLTSRNFLKQELENKIVYISGPMRGYNLYNCVEFFNAAIFLREIGSNPFCQAGLPIEDVKKVLRRDLVWLIDNAEALYMLKGWEDSNGARAEHYLAKSIGLDIYDYNGNTL